ncbi:uncharacterized protein L969DRAFT_89119 [Mixia osmundae IAM 14324]|uniref:Uncharacterized protein n=1 Tax=Mixia osmundae (strain CBS 9802 / IAM 14324 / JCM 22182 / KY 12970) TaxID=764103 RepID=G7E0P6_MIXOS|nr:uncharacterized protein L969DRAFT_89119 [Mixia osmundae IAM 14324]KEI37882.1 hypothetical protein L969DRAFT_89119 [Mixia osmundae IAM 14324]GAA96406.1 hypothetical protein E5Q_03073 [Mixia osmundae IAM 14324]
MKLTVYLVSFIVLISTVTLTIIGAAMPNWIKYTTPASSPFPYRTTYGLFAKCDSTPLTDGWRCRSFPNRSKDCSPSSSLSLASDDPERALQSEDQVRIRKRRSEGFGFCELWLTAGYVTSLSIVFGLGAILSIILVMFGGRKRRQEGWKVCSVMISLHAAFQILATAIIAQLYNGDDRFWYGTKLGSSFVLTTISWSLDIVLVVAILAGGYIASSEEDGYQAIPN